MPDKRKRAALKRLLREMEANRERDRQEAAYRVLWGRYRPTLR